MDYFIDFHVISKKLRINICSHHLNIFASLWKCERYPMFIQNAFSHHITLIFIFQLSLISQSIFDIFLFNHDQFVMLHFDKLIQKIQIIWHTTNDLCIGRPLPPPLLSREETKMDMMRKSNFQLMVSCFNVWWRSFVITMVADFLHNRGETSN